MDIADKNHILQPLPYINNRGGNFVTSVFQCNFVCRHWADTSTPGPWLLRISVVRFSLVRIFKK